MGRYGYLIKNIGLLTLSNFATKILSFLLVPLYTSVLTTGEYGVYDLFNTTISLLIPILTLNISNAIMRFSLDNGADHSSILTSGVKYFLRAMSLIVFLVVINNLFNIIPVFNEYTLAFILLFATDAIHQIIQMFVRGIEKINIIALSGIVTAVVTILCNILFLLVFKMGIIGYFMANICGILSAIIFSTIGAKLWIYIDFKNIDRNLEKEMITYSIPLIANSIAWWVNSASDRYIIILFCGISVNGVYAVASKIPSILNIFQNIFNQAWSISAVRSFDDKDKEIFFSKIYNLYNLGMVSICSLLIILNWTLAKILFAKEFYDAWKYAPLLLIAVVFGALSGYIGGIFTALREPSIFAKTTVYGAVLNFIINLFLVYLIGPMGAAIATVVSYFFVLIIRLLFLQKYISLHIKLKRDLIVYGILVIQTLVLFLKLTITTIYYMQGILFVLIMIAFMPEIKMLQKNLIKRKKGVK